MLPIRLGAALGAALVALPIIALALAAARGSGDLWPHLARHVLPGAAAETVLLLAGVGAVAVLTGTGTAWLVACHRFPGRRLLSAALILPLALPTYVSAYAWLDVMHPAGAVQSGLRGLLGLSDPRALPLPEIRSLPGCVMVMGGVLYPYVYLAARTAFLTQGSEALLAARSLGAGGGRLFLSVGLPMAWPAIAAGTSLALLEALNDVGAAEFLGVRTLTVSVYVTWITRSSLEGAAQIALILLLLVSALVLVERWCRVRGAAVVKDQASPLPRALAGPSGWLAAGACALPVLLGFAVPVSYLVWAAAVRVAEFGLPADLWSWLSNSALLALAATWLALPVALMLAAAARGDAMGGPSRAGTALLRASLLGYALPGGIAAVGLIVAFGAVDDLTLHLGTWFPALSGTGAALVAAYVIRFVAIPAGGAEAAYERVRPEIDAAARGLGARPAWILARIHLPLLSPALGASALLVFLDVMKELPATLLLRPFNTETLATALYAEAARGSYEDGAVAALTLVASGLPMIALLVLGARKAEGAAAR